MISDREPLHVPVWSPGCPLWRILTGILCPPGWVSTEKGEMQWKGTLTLWRKKEAHPPPVDMMQVSLPPFFLHTTFSPISAFTYNIPSSYSFNLSSFFLTSNTFIYFCLCWVFLDARAFSSCGEWGLLSSWSACLIAAAPPVAGHRLSACGLPLLQFPASRAIGSVVVWGSGLAASRHVGSSWTRDWTCVSWISRWIPYHWATREAPNICLSIWPIWELFEIWLMLHLASKISQGIESGSEMDGWWLFRSNRPTSTLENRFLVTFLTSISSKWILTNDPGSLKRHSGRIIM